MPLHDISISLAPTQFAALLSSHESTHIINNTKVRIAFSYNTLYFLYCQGLRDKPLRKAVSHSEISKKE